MRKVLILLAVLCLYINSYTQTWYNAASITGLRSGAFSFAIGGYGYCGMGDNGANFVDLWKYDPLADTWSQVSTPPCGPRTGGFAFVVDSFAYIGLGNSSTDCWKYNGYTDQWFSIDSFPGGAKMYPACFQIGNSGFVGTGSVSRDFWKYDVVNDSWTQIDSLPGAARKCATSYTINGTGYVGLGSDGGWNAFTDFWKYDTTNGWTALNPFPGAGREGAVGLALMGKGYICAGGAPLWTFYDELWEYDPSLDSWSQMQPLPSYARKWMTGFVVDSTAFFGSGCMYGFDPPTYYFNDFYKFSFSILMDAHDEQGDTDFSISVMNAEYIKINSSNENNGAVVSLYSVWGEEVSRAQMVGTSCELSTSGFSAGIYVVVIETSQKRFRQKVPLH